MSRKNILKREKGQSLVELAITFTMIMFLLSGVVDLGRAFLVVIALRDAAQEGAVYGSLNPTDVPGIHDRVYANSTSPVNLAESTGRVTPFVSWPNGKACAGPVSGSTDQANGIRVAVTYDFEFVMPLFSAFIGSNSLPITVAATNTIITPPCIDRFTAP